MSLFNNRSAIHILYVETMKMLLVMKIMHESETLNPMEYLQG